jgi:diamine N-acetyltransferase
VPDAAHIAPTFTLRVGRPDDAAALAALGATTFVETFGAENRPADVAAHLAAHFSPALQAREVADRRSSFIVAERDDELAGYARTLDGDAPSGVDARRPRELARLYVRASALGTGLGRALMRRVLDDAHAAGHDALWLGVWEHNARARRFYARWHFTEVGEVPYVLGEDVQRDLVLVVALPAADPAA